MSLYQCNCLNVARLFFDEMHFSGAAYRSIFIDGKHDIRQRDMDFYGVARVFVNGGVIRPEAMQHDFSIGFKRQARSRFFIFIGSAQRLGAASQCYGKADQA